jgi:BCD family chlorophyll transporter-like MFS transporter
MSATYLSWPSIVRLGLVQTALGAIVVLTTSTINRVMVVELALPAMLPGALVTLHYALQVLRPRWGHGSDVGGRRTPWIIGGMAALALGGFIAALSVWVMSVALWSGIAVAVAGFLLIGAGVGASGTSLLVLLAKQTEPKRRPAAATAVWIMMIAGFIATAATAGHFLDPFSPQRLVAVAGAICALAFLLTLVAVFGVEGTSDAVEENQSSSKPPFAVALREVWRDTLSRRFAIFIFVSMLAYSAQDLILEPFAGLVFGYTPGESTKLSGLQNGGVLTGMLLVGILATALSNRRASNLRLWTVAGCVASAAALTLLAMAALTGPGWPLKPSVFFLGFSNGVFAVAAIGSMFSMTAEGQERREGVRMGLFGAAQAIAFGLGGFTGTVLVDLFRFTSGSAVTAFAAVFILEALAFLVAALLAQRISAPALTGERRNPLVMAAAHNARPEAG